MKPLTSTRAFQVIASAALAPLVFLQSACASSAEPPPNIITVQVDTVRAEDLRQEVSLSPQEVKEVTARMMATRDTQDVTQAAVSRLNSVTHRTSQRSLQQLTAMLSTLATSPEASASFLQKLGGKALLERTSTAFSLSWASDDPGAELARSLAATLHVGEPQLALRNAADSQTLANGVTSQLLEEITNGIGSSNTPQALSLLLYGSKLSTSFLDATGTGLEKADLLLQSTERDWRQLAGNGNTAPIPAELRTNSFDPGVALMTALSQNPETAFDFFKTPDSLIVDYKALITSHQIHWIQNRPWSHDHFTSLMAALEAAVSGNQQKSTIEETEEENKESDQRAAMATTIVELLGNRALGYETIINQGKNERRKRKDYFTRNTTQETLAPEALSTSAIVNLAKLVLTYPQSIDASLDWQSYYDDSQSFAGENLFERIPGDYTGINSPIFDYEYLSWAFTTILSNEEGKAYLFGEIEKYQEQRVHSRAKVNPKPEKKEVGLRTEDEIRQSNLMSSDRHLQVFLWERTFRVEAEKAQKEDSQVKTLIEAPGLIPGFTPSIILAREDPTKEIAEKFLSPKGSINNILPTDKKEITQQETLKSLLGIYTVGYAFGTELRPKEWREGEPLWAEIIGINPLYTLASNGIIAIQKILTSKFAQFEKTFNENKEEIKSTLPRKRTAALLRSFFNNRIIGMHEVRSLAEELGDDRETVESWFTNGQFPSEEEIAENYDLQSFLRELSLRALESNYYEQGIVWYD